MGLDNIPPGGEGAIYVHFSPKARTVFNYPDDSSNDPMKALVEVALSGNGVSPQIPPSEQIENILTFFRRVGGAMEPSWAAAPAIRPKGRLGALRNMIEQAKALIDAGYIAEAIQQLQSAYAHVDGQPRPPDFAAGPAAAELADLIQQLIDSLGGLNKRGHAVTS